MRCGQSAQGCHVCTCVRWKLLATSWQQSSGRACLCLLLSSLAFYRQDALSLVSTWLHSAVKNSVDFKYIDNTYWLMAYRRNKKQYKQHFQRGAASSKLAESPLKGKDAKKTGTRVSFLYDKTIFSSR